MNLEEAKKEATEIIHKDSTNFQLRSCWNCNGAHEHLKKSEIPIKCFECGKAFHKGFDITTYG